MLQSREMDGKCRVIFRSGHEGEKLKKTDKENTKKSNINKQSNKKTKQTNKGFQPKSVA